jgi:hypothetical protein
MNSTGKEVYNVVEDLINAVVHECRRDHRCVSCEKDERTIHCRGAWLTKSRVYETNIDSLIDAPLNMGYGSKICKSCTHQTKHCIDCGLSETLMYESLLTDDTDSVVFKECKSEWPIVSRCPDCYERYRRYVLHSHLYYTSESEEELCICERCGREWDGHAQCPCGLDYSSEDDNDRIEETEEIEEPEPKIVLRGGLIDMINTLYEIKEDIPEGKYLKMMNIMKVMNDSLKKIPES